jgi:ribosome-associated heat shock protein Hsp15
VKETIRIDKWLWAARFFKTRSIAADAVAGGKVQLHGTRTKPAKEIHIGDKLSVRRGPYEWVVVVRGLTPRRGPAKDAVLLYNETEESKRNRETIVAQMQFERPAHLQSIGGRPSKKARREIIRFTKGNR